MILLDPITRDFINFNSKDYEAFFQEYNETFLLSVYTIICRSAFIADG